MRTRVLIIEDEPNLRASMARGLSKLEGVEVVDAGTLGGALALIDQAAPDVVLSDIDLPDRSGIEVLGELGRRGLRVPVVFISAYLKAYGPQIPPHADVEVREKPVGLEELRRLVLSKASAERGSGDAAPFGVTDYLQIACLGRRSVVVEVGGPGGAVGRIVVADGTVWSARDGETGGEEAFQRLVLRTDTAVGCRSLKGDPGPRELFGSCEELLLEVARRQDEEQEAAAQAAAQAGAVPELAELSELAAPQGPTFDDLWEEGVAALLSRDHTAAARAFQKAHALRPDDGRVAANLKRLRQMGVIEG